MPCVTTVFAWQLKYPEFAKEYEVAQKMRTEFLMEELCDIADDSTGDVQRDKLRLDTRKWAISKMNPKKYGDKVETTHSGSVEIQQIKRTIIDNKS
jgi:hypothetical protein